MLFKDPSKNKPFRIQGIWVSPEEIQRVVEFVKREGPNTEYLTKITEYKAKEEGPSELKDKIGSDPLFESAIKTVVNDGKGSTSYLQRRLSIGYNRAARILDELAEIGVVGQSNGGKPRDVLVTDADAFLNSFYGRTTEEEKSLEAETIISSGE